MSGRSVAEHIASTTSRVNDPGSVDVPSRNVGFAPLMVSSSVVGPLDVAHGMSDRFFT